MGIFVLDSLRLLRQSVLVKQDKQAFFTHCNTAVHRSNTLTQENGTQSNMKTEAKPC